MNNSVITSLISDPAHWEHQLKKLREFKNNMRKHIQKAKEAEKPKPQPIQSKSDHSIRKQALIMATRAKQRVVL